MVQEKLDVITDDAIDEDDGSGVGMIIGVVVGILVVIILGVVGFLIYRRRKKNRGNVEVSVKLRAT